MANPTPFKALLSALLLTASLTSQANATPITLDTTTNIQQQEDLEAEEPGFGKNTIDNSAGEDWTPTENPQEEIKPGQMRSDREVIPGGFTKEEADRAEIQEASERNSGTQGRRTRRSTPSNCRTYWPSPYKVCGAIREKYDSLGGPKSFLTWPKSDELGVPDGVGRRNEFINGFIYWHPDTGANSVTTHFSLIWAKNGWEAGSMGYPTSDEYGLPDKIGRRQDFQNAHLYGSLHGFAVVRGAIFDRWQELGAENGPLGYPTSDETTTPDGIGKFTRFAGGMIYWHPSYGAHEITGAPLLIWSARGYETSEWGYPTAPAKKADDVPVAVAQEFSKKNMDVRELLSESGESLVNGKSVNNLIIELLNANGINIPTNTVFGTQSAGKRAKRATSKCAIPDSSQSQYGTVSIPSTYDFWGCIKEAKNWPHYGRHDYCTKSPDQYPAPGKNAEFSGACARHDMCMDSADSQGIGYGGCNNALHRDMETVCSNVYSGVDPRRYNCRDFRDVYWIFVTSFHLNNL